MFTIQNKSHIPSWEAILFHGVALRVCAWVEGKSISFTELPPPASLASRKHQEREAVWTSRHQALVAFVVFVCSVVVPHPSPTDKKNSSLRIWFRIYFCHPIPQLSPSKASLASLQNTWPTCSKPPPPQCSSFRWWLTSGLTPPHFFPMAYWPAFLPPTSLSFTHHKP